ncbi:MAG TPA: DNA-binding domain-containing protein [Burkholderiales bacterium]|nr:DNA-binding domain-containing protein [Burkholderiales bacterium]
MASLRDIQSAFVQALFEGQEAWLARYILAGGVAPGARLAVYRNNTLHNYHEALRAVYPVVERLVGEEFFGHAARRYAFAYPSRSGDIQNYGESFPEFLAALPGTAELPYLRDTARLEWLVHEAFHAAEHPPLNLEALAAVPAERYPDLRFAVHPSCRLLASPYPVHLIWAVNQPQHSGEESIDLGIGGVRLLMWRPRFQVEMLPLGVGEHALLAALAAGQTLGAACDAALAAEDGFDIAAALRAHTADGVLVGFAL